MCDTYRPKGSEEADDLDAAQRLALQPLMTARLLTGNAPMRLRVNNAPESALFGGSPVLTGKNKQEAILEVGV